MGKSRKSAGISNNFLREAVADAKTVRETALENAKIALQEAFNPRIQSMLSDKLQKEAEMDDDDEATSIDTEMDSEDEGGDAEMDSEDEGGGEDMDVEDDDMDSEDEDVDDEDMDSEDEDELDLETILKELESDDSGDDEDMDSEDELDLESILKELESDDSDDSDDDEDIDLSDIEDSDDDDDMDSEDEDVDDDEDVEISELFNDEDEDEDIELSELFNDDEDEDDDEDIELSELFNDEDEDEDEDDMTEHHISRINSLESSLQEHRKAVRVMRDKLNEVNILNAKLLFCNKLFRNFNMNNSSKMTIIENFDRAKNVREIKLIYATLIESMKQQNSVPRSVKRITESASRIVASTKPRNNNILNENADFEIARIKKLAGIK